jgi:uracil-DNA glycosylase family 4
VPKVAAHAPELRPLPAARALTLPAGTKAERLAWVHGQIAQCPVTLEHLKSPQKPVLGVGSAEAKILFIGEAPTLEEAEAGRAFVGPAGELLRKIVAATGLSEKDIYVASLMGWRPEPPTAYGKRPPNAAEVAFNLPYLRAQIEAIRGVDCSTLVRQLQVRELVVEVGRMDTVGRPVLFGTSEQFLRQFGLTSLAELPPLAIPVGDESVTTDLTPP